MNKLVRRINLTLKEFQFYRLKACGTGLSWPASEVRSINGKYEMHEADEIKGTLNSEIELKFVIK